MKIEFTLNRVRYQFAENGLLQSVRLPEEYNFRELLSAPMTLGVSDAGGAPLALCANAKTRVTQETGEAGQITVVFSDLGFAGRPDLRLDLKHEFFPDGAFFSSVFFCGNCCQPQALSKFELKLAVAIAPDDAVRSALFYRPKCADGTLIQTSAPDRDVACGDNRTFDSILPLTEFFVQTAQGPTFYAEFFMEADGSLAGKAGNTASHLQWNCEGAEIAWNFLVQNDVPNGGVWQWSNVFGGVIAPAVRKRRFAPFVMYHYFDNFRRYPTEEILEAIAAAGADVLIIHENWRSNIQNGGTPFLPDELQRVIASAHRKNIRVALYMRGNEISDLEERLEWFPRLLQKDFDGLYMDYGGPFHFIDVPNETFPGGRIRFRHHYNECRFRRQVIGRDGVHFSHTGPMFSALGLIGEVVDGYVSGEGERGLLIKSRFDHAYYSMAPVCSGSLWSAAFPEYGSAAMVPFIAATGQFPHLPLGTQFQTSSLSHPAAPGIADRPFQELWRLWQLMQSERDMEVRNDYNSVGVFPRQPEISHYLMFTPNRAVCIYANFAKTPVAVNPAVNWAKAGFDAAGKTVTLCRNFQTMALEDTFTLAPGEVAAIVVGEADFARYSRPLPDLCEEAKKHLALVESQRALRQAGDVPAKWQLRVAVPDIPLPYEMSMVVDLYDNRFILGEMAENGKFTPVGYIGKNGFQTRETAKEEFVVNGETSPWLDLNAILGSGVHHVAIQSLHRGELYYTNTPFYSFIAAELESDRGERREIRFMNELEEDRSFLKFSVNLQ